MAQTTDAIGADGTIYCLDLAHEEAQKRAVTLAQTHSEVASILRSRDGNMHYLLVMVPNKEPNQTQAMLARPAMLMDGLSIMYARSRDFGAFDIIVVPNSQHVLDLWNTVRMD